MGAMLLTFCRPAVRSLLLGILAALAWLVLGAVAAQAALPALDAGATLQQATPSPLVQSVPLQAPPAIPPPAPPAISGSGDAPVATATAFISPVAEPTEPLVAAAAPVPAETTETVSGLAPAIPLVEELLPLPLPEVLPTPAPGAVPAADRGLFPLPTPASAAPGPGDSALLSAPEPGEGTARASTAATPRAFDGTIRTFGFTAAQDLVRSPAVPGATSSRSIPSETPGTPGTPGRLRVSALPRHSGAGPTSPGGPAGAADIAESLPELPATTGAISRPEAETLPAGPSIDPGSSPD